MVRLQFGEWLVVNCSDQRADLPGWLLAAGQPGHCTKHVTCVTNVRQCMLLMSTIKLQCNFPILTFVKKKPANYCIFTSCIFIVNFFQQSLDANIVLCDVFHYHSLLLHILRV